MLKLYELSADWIPSAVPGVDEWVIEGQQEKRSATCQQMEHS